MKKLHLIFAALLASLAFVACGPNDGPESGDNTAHERIVFTLLNSEEPVVAAPDEDITYKFKIAYSQGIKSVCTMLNGEVVEGSEMNYIEIPAPELVAAAEAEGDTAIEGDTTPDDSTTPEEDATPGVGLMGAPTEVEYTFNYTVKGSQFGETLDFVFTATGADDYTQSVDYALWVTANAVEFTALLPEGLPTSIYSDVTVSFDVAIECGNILKSIEVFKNGEAYASKSDFTDQKTFNYPFTYTPAEEDINNTVEFHFVATDVKGNTAETYYTVSVVKADAVGKMLWSENFNTSMSISTTTAFDTTEGGISGGGATQFDKTNIVKYGTLYIANPDDPEGEMIPQQGALEGCEVYDGDKSALTYTSDGTDSCLSKYGPNGESVNMTGGYLWYRKAKKGWFQVDGIKLHSATSLKLTYSQAGGKMAVSYSIDGGASWTVVSETSDAAELNEAKFTLPSGAETITLRFTEGDGTKHCRIDNIKLVEVL